jgi:WS/DGAT/MGAT family acyltransferase
MAMAYERLSSLDTAFLRLESAGAPLHLGALAIFQPARPIPPVRLAALLGERAERLPALRWRAVEMHLPPGAHCWVADQGFDPRSHICLHRLDPRDRSELAAAAAAVMAEPLDLDQPLWQLHILTGLGGGATGLGGGAFAVLLKLHHALADGLRAVELGLGLVDGFTDAVAERLAAVPADSPGPLGLLLSTSYSALRLSVCPYLLTRHVVSTAAGVPAAVRHVTDMAGIAASVLSSVRRIRPTSPLSTASHDSRRLALLRLDLAGVREVRRRHGGTDHDVLLTVLSGALRTWLDRRGQRADGPDPRALIPVSRRRRPDGRRHGNVLSGYLCPLPIQETDPVARLHAIRGTMSRAKVRGPERGAGAFPFLADQVPSAVHRVVAPLARHSARWLFDTVVTNVPVPDLKLTVRGAPLCEVYPIVPLAHGHALGVALTTHRGTVHIGLHANGQAVPDLDLLAQDIPTALDTLRAAGRPAQLPRAA